MRRSRRRECGGFLGQGFLFNYLITFFNISLFSLAFLFFRKIFFLNTHTKNKNYRSLIIIIIEMPIAKAPKKKKFF